MARIFGEDQLTFWNRKSAPGGSQWAMSPKTLDRFREAIMTPKVLETLKSQPVEPIVVDFGCGIGRIVRHLYDTADKLELGREVGFAGIDFSPTAIEEAHKLVGDRNIYLVVNENKSIPFPNESVDMFYAFTVFQHLTQDQITAYLAEMKRTLKLGGVLRIQTLQGEPSPYRTRGGWHGRYFETLDEFVSEFENAGYKVVETQTAWINKAWFWVTAQKEA